MKICHASLSLFLVVCSLTHSFSQIPRRISYQGVLSDTSDTPRPDGTYPFTFRLYEAPSGGTQIWFEAKLLPVKRGLFSTVMGDVTPFSDSLKFNRPYWLSLQIGDDPELFPRTLLTPAPYSLSADSARIAGSVAINSITSPMIANGQVVRSLNGLRDAITLRAQGGATITSNNDTITINSGPGGGGTGIQGIQNTNNTLDVLNPGGPTATVNLKVPLNLNASSSSWIFSARNTGPGSAAIFSTTNPNWGGVTVDVEASGGPNNGLAAVAYGTGTALIAQNTATGYAIDAISASGDCISATSDSGIGIVSTAYTDGVYASGDIRGVTGLSDDLGVLGIGYGVGVLGFAASSNAVAIQAQGAFNQMGGPFLASPTTTQWTTNKPATVKLQNGTQVKLFTEESTEIYFSDYGSGVLEGGRIHVELDPVFLQTVTIDQAHPMKVFVQLEDDCKGVYVSNKLSTGFDVIELQKGGSNAHFSYRVVCKRKYYEDERLATQDDDIKYNTRVLQTVWPEVLQKAEVERAKAEHVLERDHRRPLPGK